MGRARTTIQKQKTRMMISYQQREVEGEETIQLKEGPPEFTTKGGELGTL